MKLNLLGFGHAFNLAEILSYYEIQADCNSSNYKHYDWNIYIGLWYLPKKPPENSTVFLMGSDVWRDLQMMELKALNHVKLILTPNIEMYKKVTYESPLNYKDWKNIPPAEEWHMPLNTTLFPQSEHSLGSGTLCYAPQPETYCLNRILQEPGQITLLGLTGFLIETYPNIHSIQNCPWHNMPQLYRRHANFKLWLNHPATGGPSLMIYEALRMGLKSFFNDEEITEIPNYVKMTYAIPKLIKILEKHT